MKVNVAGAGAGKTTLMSDLITGCVIPEGKVVFCIAFTNSAADNIFEKVEKKLGEVPDNIRISTIHSFLYQELISPYYYFLYGKQYEQISVIDLPDNEGLKGSKLSELENDSILHITKIPEKAKWVAYQKSSDRKAIKDLRRIILNRFSNYCEAIYVDEAQDISEDVRLILESFDKVGVKIILYGDPKQDVKGTGQFKEIIDMTPDVNFISVCHRCPQKHLDISNTLASVSEQQIAAKDNADGSVEVVFESDIDNVQDFLDSGNFGLKYISMKRSRFATHGKREHRERFETLLYEVHRAMAEKWSDHKSELEINRAAFYVTERMLKDFDYGSKAEGIISKWVKSGTFDRLDSKRYFQMISAFCSEDDSIENIPVVSSIEIIKGCEAERCLFILSPDLAPYLFLDKTDDNRFRHLLYVALTRSLDQMTIMIMKEVEIGYTREKIVDFFNR